MIFSIVLEELKSVFSKWLKFILKYIIFFNDAYNNMVRNIFLPATEKKERERKGNSLRNKLFDFTVRCAICKSVYDRQSDLINNCREHVRQFEQYIYLNETEEEFNVKTNCGDIKK